MNSQRDEAEMEGKRILIVDEEESLGRLARYLSTHGCKVTCESHGEKAFELARREVPDLITLDFFLPGLNGLAFMKHLSSDPVTGSIPVIIVTERDAETDIVLGLELGADDYIIKPISNRLLLARVMAVLRRSTPARPGEQSILRVHDLTIEQKSQEVSVGGMDIQLTHTEYRLICLLAKKPGWVYSRSEIIRKLQRGENRISERSVDVLVYGLRKKLGPAGTYIESVRGVGYRCI
jgi:two-component system alkaline phosphatase synthesis response regulator PhoP